MKKIVIMLLLLSLVVSQFAVTINVKSGSSMKGEITNVDNEKVTIKTRMGSRTIFRTEIKSIVSDSGIDVTNDYLDAEPGQLALPAHAEVNKKQLNRTSTASISTPLWVIAGTLLAWSAYSVYRMNNPKKIPIPTPSPELDKEHR